MNDIVRDVIYSHLLFNTWEETTTILTKKVDKWSKITNSHEQEVTYRRLLDKCMEETGYSLEFMISRYEHASAELKSNDFWDGGRREGTKLRFVTKLFVNCYMPESPASNALLNEISDHRTDAELMEKFLNPAPYPVERIDVCFTVLLVRKIIVPYSVSSHNYKGPDRQKMLDFLEDLKSYLKGNVGIYENLPILEELIEDLKDSALVLTIATAWKILNDIGETLRYLSVEYTMTSGLLMSGWELPGIWIDDADQGDSRFWIIPGNYKMAFRYTKKDGNLILTPFEFCKYSYREDMEETICTFIHPKGDKQILTNGKCDRENVVYAEFEEHGETEAYITEVDFTPISRGFGDWFNWRKFLRLSPQDSRYIEFSRLLEDCYTTKKHEMERLCSLKCHYRWMIDFKTALVGIDHKYIYLMNYAKDSHFTLIRKEGDFFEYVCSSTSVVPPALTELKITPDKPLYKIKRQECQYERENAVFKAEKALSLKTEFEEFKEVVRNTGFDDQVTIYDLGIDKNQEKINKLCFNQYSRSFDLHKIIKPFGIQVITDRNDLFYPSPSMEKN